MDLFSLTTEPQTWSVADITRYIRETLESDYRLRDLLIAGEVSNLSRPTSGHLYFTLKDGEASLRCVMWRPIVSKQTYLPKNGEAVEVRGHISVYDAGGQYQLYADRIHPAGEGSRFQEFLRLKELLENEGVFDQDKKQTLPAWPQRIGVVTSPTGAALRDVIHVIQRRYPVAEILLSPTPVQGDQAPMGIVAALEAMNSHGRPDVILLVRGGGSVEDLWAFNDEEVVRAVCASESPIVTGIGHETDLILSDFAADVRAPTPSAAAEVATPDRTELDADVYEARYRIWGSFRDDLTRRRHALELLEGALRLNSPRARVANARQHIDDLLIRANATLNYDLSLARTLLAGTSQTLQAVSPLDVLARGYALITRVEDGQIVRSVKQTSPGDQLTIQVQDGKFPAQTGQPEPKGSE